jgi:group I intron endonuclease
VKLSDADLAYLETHGKSGIYCIALKDSVWQEKLEADGDPETSKAYPKVYVGQSGASKGIKHRIGGHLRELRKGSHRNSKLQHAFDRYGESAFECWIIESCQNGALNAREEYWIELFAAFTTRGYNIARCASAPAHGRKFGPCPDERKAKIGNANLGSKRTTEQKAAISARLLGNKNRRGIPHSPESIAKISATGKGRKKSPETIEKMRAAANRPERLAQLREQGKNLSQATRARMRAAHSGAKNHFYGKTHSAESRARMSKNCSMKNPESVAKMRATKARKTREQKAEILARAWATRRANKERKRREMIMANLAILIEQPTPQIAA